MDCSASKKRIIFHDTANKQTQSYVKFKKQTKTLAVNLFVLENFFNENATRKKKKRPIKRNDVLRYKSITEGIFAVYFFSYTKGSNNIFALTKFLV